MAVLAVIAFHTGAVTGGFVGVDVFFVISGFLITRLLWAELGHNGRVDLVGFYAARARRLLPAAGVVLVATGLAAVAILPALQARTVLDDGLASALYVGNYRFAITGTDYLAHAAPSPFQHYWSLGVEEQFYLVWPAVLLGAVALLGRSRGAAVAVLAMLGAGSLWLSLTWTQTLPPWAFFSLPTRAWELAAGALIALTATAWRRLPPGFAALAGFGGLGLIGWSCLRFDQQTPYPGTAALVPVAGAVLVVAAGCSAPRRAAGRWLSVPVMRALGRLSYSWYLWHWPILVLAPVALGHPLGWAGRAAAVGGSLLLAVLTLRYVERPVRYAVGLRRSSGRSLALGSVITAAAVSAALLLPMLVPAPVGPGQPATAAFVQPVERPRLIAAGASDPVAVAAAPLRTLVAASADRRQVPADLSPSLDGAAADKPDVFYNGCVRSWLEVGVPTCESGDTSSSTTVALVGDSHAAMWKPALEPVAREQHWRLSTMAKVTCPLQDLPIRSPYLGRDYTECVKWREEVMQRLAAERPRLVLLGMSRRYGSDFGFAAYSQTWLDSLTTLVADIRAATGARVLVLGPVPDPHSVVPVCVSGELGDANACAPTRAEAINADGIAAEATATRRGGGQYAELADLFCATEICPVIIDNDLVFRDDNHVTTTYARRLEPVFATLVRQSLSPSS